MNNMPVAGEESSAVSRKIMGLLPAALAIVYPFLLRAFHAVVATSESKLSAPQEAAAALLLILAFALPLS